MLMGMMLTGHEKAMQQNYYFCHSEHTECRGMPIHASARRSWKKW